MGSDFWLVVRWWGVLFLVGAAAFPLAKRLFSSWPASSALRSNAGWWDKGYFFSKAIGMAIVTYIVYVAGTLKILPFSTGTIVFSLAVVFGLGLFLNFTGQISLRPDFGKKAKIKNTHSGTSGQAYQLSKRIQQMATQVLVEEIFFFVALLVWSWVKGHEASIRSLEKFMDFGFTKTILHSQFFPIPDMWYAGYPINYYYFGHIVMAVLTKLSGIDLAYTFNLMLATVFALTATMSFSIGYQLIKLKIKDQKSKIQIKNQKKEYPLFSHTLVAMLAGLLTSFLVTLGGNMQTLYAFTKGYTGDNVKPFWELLWKPSEFLQKLPEGLDRYWYANATRFIPFTIHEFPSYSFVVSDMHGHVLSLPFTLLAIAFLVEMYQDSEVRINREFVGLSLFYGLLASILLMTNALDGPIYLGLYLILLGIKVYRGVGERANWLPYAGLGVAVGALWVIGSLPFLSHFHSFVSGLAINCPPAFLAAKSPAAINKIGPFLFEGVEKCQHSPLWMWWLLWGFFVYCGGFLIVSLVTRFLSSRPLSRDLFKKDDGFRVKPGMTNNDTKFSQVEKLLLVFFVFSLLLIIFPEFFYFKDIYPAHFRSNTMFKLGYQAFIMFSIVSGYSIITTLFRVNPGFGRNDKLQMTNDKWARKIFFVLLIPQLFLVSIYPLFSVRSYFGGLREYTGLYGLNWMINEYPDDYKALEWLNQELRTKNSEQKTINSMRDSPKSSALGSYFPFPVIVEADGDSYTDYNHFSAFAGVPTIVGWAVHEWLWRGSYDVVSPRREEVRKIYESASLAEVRTIVEKYHLRYIIVGKLERQKFTRLNENIINEAAERVYSSGNTSIYQVR